MKFIIICATGRSGSTTLQRIINTIKDSDITGENDGAINNLLETYLSIKKTNKIRISSYEESCTKVKPAWYNNYNFVIVKENIKNTILSIIHCNSKRVSGFKEIRYFNKMYLIDAFIELFPNTKVICNIDDNTYRQCKSNWWVTVGNSKNHLIEHNKQYIDYCKKNKNSYLFYMKYLFDISEVKKLFVFLNEDFDKKKYDYIIKNNLG